MTRLVLTVSFALSLIQFFPSKVCAQQSKGIRSEKNISFLIHGGLGYTFYKMESEKTLIEDLSETGKLNNLDDPSGGISSQIGLGMMFHDPLLRVYSDIRWDNYGNEGIKIPIFAFDLALSGLDNSGYYLNHSMTTVNLHADKLFWQDVAEKKLYYGFGGSYGWVFDTRQERVTFRKDGDDQEIKEDIDINANVAGIQAVIGRFYENGVSFSEFRLGYQVETGYTIESSKKTGRSAKSFKPDYNGIKISIHLGLAL
ncbi:MAG: hypothetical protein J0L62_01940 [Bacteroidetes bacterium]|nr:hypothetical protein [Bacteroidota bacterium]